MIAYHSIFGTYGFWLPNDPRGSGSDYIAVWDLFRYGGPTRLASRRTSVAARPHDHQLRIEAKQALRYPPVVLTDELAAAVVDGFAVACQESGYSIHACAVMPDHVHLVIGSHPRNIRQLVGHLKSRATRRMRQCGAWFADSRPVWGEHGWNVYLDDVSEVTRAIAHTQNNPLRDGRPEQHWPLVTPFEIGAAAPRGVIEVKRTKIGVLRGGAWSVHRSAGKACDARPTIIL